MEVVDGEAYLWSGGDWRGATDTRDSPAPPAVQLRLTAVPGQRIGNLAYCGGPGQRGCLPGTGWDLPSLGAGLAGDSGLPCPTGRPTPTQRRSGRQERPNPRLPAVRSGPVPADSRSRMGICRAWGAGLASDLLVPVAEMTGTATGTRLTRRRRRPLFSFSFFFKYLQKERKKEGGVCSGCSSCSGQEPYSYIVGSAERCRARRENSFPRGLLEFKNRPGKRTPKTAPGTGWDRQSGKVGEFPTI